MKKVKVVLWILITGLIVLFIFQNQEFITEKQILKINLYIVDSYQTPELPNVLLLLCCFLVGCLLYYFLSLSQRFKSKKNIKKLISTVDAHREKIFALERELESLKTAPIRSTEDTSERPDEKNP